MDEPGFAYCVFCSKPFVLGKGEDLYGERPKFYCGCPLSLQEYWERYNREVLAPAGKPLIPKPPGW